ncbi:MAG TPA: FxSxx-COOH system tetratricopeptide repeat protein [Candidatus Bathyarchaeia archaeon]|nr:FxSxx-COOH system tetratricopeptide repeat protein [Candidatus Bathyarchaeia archaeon]
MKHFFISYNKADREWAEWIAWALDEAGYTTIIQAWDFGAGSNFVLEMDRAAKEAERTIAVLSPDYLTALYTQPEWAAAFAQDPTGEKRTLIPMRVRECKLQGLLAQIVYIDLVGKNEIQGRETLLAAAKGGRLKPATAPGFPGARKLDRASPRFPGALPDIWNVPHLRNPNFTGREDLLRSLRSALTSGRPAAVTQAIAGLGGVGKTQLAVEYAYRHKADYSVVWWVRAEEPATLTGNYADLAGQLGLPESDSADRPATAQAVRSWLEHYAGWLLILDNANNAAQCRDYIPRGDSGHVIVTSRDPLWSGVAEPLRVGVMNRPDAAAFLEKRVGRSDAAIDGLCDALGDLPLALEQAAAYIEASGISVAEYLAHFEKYARELLKRPSPSADYPHTVATTWQLAFERLENEAPAALDLLYLLAYLAPDNIGRDLITGGGEHFPPRLAQLVSNPVDFDSAIAALRRYSLIEVRDGSFSVHRLVQAVIRSRLGDRNAESGWAESALRLASAAFPFRLNQVETWSPSARSLPHALAAAGHSERLGTGLEHAVFVLSQAGLYLQSRAQLNEAEQLLRRVLAIDEKVYGPDHPEVATDANNLGSILQGQGDLEGALRYTQRALAIDEKVYGTDHPKVATRANNIGQILQDQGDLEGALRYTQRALAIDEKVYGTDHPNVATDASNIGTILQDRGDLGGALRYTQRALAIFEQVYGLDHPQTKVAARNLKLLQAQAAGA